MNKTSSALLKIAILIVVIFVTVIVTKSFSRKDYNDETTVSAPNPPPVFREPGSAAETNPAPDPKLAPKKAPKLVELKEGETLRPKESFPKASLAPTPPTRVDTGRLQATYEVGKTYVNLVKVNLASTGSYKDWGIKTDMNFHYVGEFQFSRNILSNDGQHVVVELQIDRAKTVSVFTEIDGISLEPGAMFQSILEGASILAGNPPGTVEIGKQTLEKVLNLSSMKEFVSEVASDQQAKIFASIDGLEGKKARIEFENGKGVVAITPIDCTLDADEQVFLEQISLVSDLVVMNSLDCQPGDSWTVPAKDFFPIVDPSLGSKSSGSVTVRRGSDLGSDSNKEARLEIAGGVFELHDMYEGESHKMKSAAKWAPKGDLIFNFSQGIITEGKLTGAVELVEQSLDHIFFEMKQVTKPSYEVNYSAWVVNGDLEAAPKLKPIGKEGTLDKIRQRVIPR